MIIFIIIIIGLIINITFCYAIAFVTNKIFPNWPSWLLAILSSSIMLVISASIFGLWYLKLTSSGCSGGECGSAQMLLGYLLKPMLIGAVKDIILSWIILQFVVRKKSKSQKVRH